MGIDSEIQLDRRTLQLALLSTVGAATLGAVGILLFDLPKGLALGLAAGAMVGMTLRMSFVVNNEMTIRLVDILLRRYEGRVTDGAADAMLVNELDRARSRLWLLFAFVALCISANVARFAISGDIGSAIAVLLPSVFASVAASIEW